jgi:hypothetical protein
VDRAQFARLLEQVAAEKTAAQHQLAALQARVSALTKTEEGLQALLDLTAESAAYTKTDFEAAHVIEESQQVAPTAGEPSRPTVPPSGAQAAKLVLQSDQSRFWPVSEVWDEEVRRGWAEARPRGTNKRNAPARIALMRLKERYPENVEVISTPVLAYRWRPATSPSQNGSGPSHAEVSG